MVNRILIPRNVFYVVLSLVVLWVGAPMALAQAPIGSISVCFVNKVTREPLLTEKAPFPWVGLVRLADDPQTQVGRVSVGLTTDSRGCTTVSVDNDGHPLLAGDFVLTGNTAEGVNNTDTDPFPVAPGQHFNYRTHGVIGLPIRLRVVKDCPDIPASGGTCRFQLQVTNAAYPRHRIVAKLWLIATADIDPNGSRALSFSEFQLGSLRPFDLQPAQSVLMDFSLRMPGSVPPGTTVCVVGYVGAGSVPQLNPIFVREVPEPGIDYNTIYCFVKSSGDVG